MKSNQTRKNLVLKLLVISALIGVMSISVGCQSGFQKPDLGQLAFWKKDEIRLASRRSETLAPPSSHFNPEPTDGATAGSMAKSSGALNATNNATNNVAVDLQSKVDNILARANNKKSADSLKQPFDKPNEKIGSINRKLFGPNGKRSDISQAAVNDIQAKLNALKSSAGELKTEMASATAAGGDFQSGGDFQATNGSAMKGSMAKAESAIPKGMDSNGFSPPTATAGSLQAKPIAGWKNDFDAGFGQQASNALQNAKNEMAQSQKTLGNNVRSNSFDNSFSAATATAASAGQKTKQAASNMFGAAKDFAANATNNVQQAAQNTFQAPASLNSGSGTKGQNTFQQATNSLAQRTGTTVDNSIGNIRSTSSIVADNAENSFAQAQQAVANMTRYDSSPNVQLPQKQPSTTAKIKFDSGQSQSSGSGTRYPATPYGSFTSPSNTHDFSSTKPKTGVIQASGSGQTGSIRQASAESEIPLELLRGNNTFAPGSVKKLNPVETR